MDSMKTRIVNNIKALLKSRGITAKGLCDETDLSYGTLRRAMGNRDEGMSTRSIVSISEALGVDFHDLTAPIETD